MPRLIEMVVRERGAGKALPRVFLEPEQREVALELLEKRHTAVGEQPGFRHPAQQQQPRLVR